MPRKIRDLKKDLQQGGFMLTDTKKGKGSHTKWEHSLLSEPVMISGHDGDDAHHYQERAVREALAAVGEAQRKESL